MPAGVGPVATIIDLNSFTAGPFIGPCCNWSPIPLATTVSKHIAFKAPPVHIGDVFPSVPPNVPCCPCGPGCCIPCLPLPRIVITASPTNMKDGRPTASLGDIVWSFPFSVIIPAGPNKVILIIGAALAVLAALAGVKTPAKSKKPKIDQGEQDPGAIITTTEDDTGTTGGVPKSQLPFIPRGRMDPDGDDSIPKTNLPSEVTIPRSFKPSPGVIDPGAVEDPDIDIEVRECEPRIAATITITSISPKNKKDIVPVIPRSKMDTDDYIAPLLYSPSDFNAPKAGSVPDGVTDPGAVEDPEVVNYCPPRIPEPLVVVDPAKPKVTAFVQSAKTLDDPGDFSNTFEPVIVYDTTLANSTDLTIYELSPVAVPV